MKYLNFPSPKCVFILWRMLWRTEDVKEDVMEDVKEDVSEDGGRRTLFLYPVILKLALKASV